MTLFERFQEVLASLPIGDRVDIVDTAQRLANIAQGDERVQRRARIHELVDAEMNRTDENYTAGDEREWGREDDKPSVEWYAADISRYMNRIAGNEE